MSAFILSQRHIDAIVTAGMAVKAFSPKHGQMTRENANDIGIMLLEENYNSVNHRYERDDTRAAYAYRFYPPFSVGTLRGPDACQAIAAALKALDCYEYQSCEHAAWEQSTANRLCQTIRSLLTAALPGYDQAPWEITG